MDWGMHRSSVGANTGPSAGRRSAEPLKSHDNEISSGSKSGGRYSGRSSSIGKRSSGVRKSGIVKPGNLLGYNVGKNRRSSGYGRGHYGHELKKDPRPISDKAYKEKSIRELLDFLMRGEHKKYPYPISYKQLHSPQTREFLHIFEFMYQYFVEHFKMGKKHEEEIPRIMKQLGYPFSITKSAMFAVGSPHTWPTLLAALTWLREQIQYTLALEVDKILFPQQGDFDSEPEKKLLFYYLEKTYSVFLEGADSFEEEDEELARQLRQNGAIGSLEELASKNRQLLSELEMLEEQPDKLPVLREEFGQLKLAEEKYDVFLTELESHGHKIEHRQQEIDSQLTELESELAVLQAENQKKQQIFDNQELSPLDVERFNMEQQQLQKEIEIIEKENEELERQLWAEEMAIGKSRDVFEKKRKAYNSAAMALKLIPATAENAEGFDFEIKSSVLMFGSAGIVPGLKSALQSVKNQRKDIVDDIHEKKLNELETLEQIQEMVLEKQKAISVEENKLKRLDESIASKKEMINRETERLQEDIDRMQDELTTLQQKSFQNVYEIQHLLAQDKQRYSQEKAEMKKAELEYGNYIYRIVQLCVNHKSVISSHLSALKEMSEQLVQEEKEKLQKEGLLAASD